VKIQCLIVDDEPPARELLASYIEKMDDLEITGQCGNALEAFAYIQKYPVHILFLDIQMPRMNGLELIKSLQERPRIILTTAYREFAVEGFELDVLDYLVKPVSFERFLKSISKYHK
jgi:YesN/AraC family two-component response regulator